MSELKSFAEKLLLHKMNLIVHGQWDIFGRKQGKKAEIHYHYTLGAFEKCKARLGYLPIIATSMRCLC